MSAETLREAAALMRERAATAKPEPWGLSTVLPGHIYHRGIDVAVSDPVTAEHIASWHPAVALAVAEWLDGVAADAWAGLAPISEHDVERTPEQRNALAVAHAYLGEGGDE